MIEKFKIFETRDNRKVIDALLSKTVMNGASEEEAKNSLEKAKELIKKYSLEDYFPNIMNDDNTNNMSGSFTIEDFENWSYDERHDIITFLEKVQDRIINTETLGHYYFDIYDKDGSDSKNDDDSFKIRVEEKDFEIVSLFPLDIDSLSIDKLSKLTVDISDVLMGVNHKRAEIDINDKKLAIVFTKEQIEQNIK